MSRQLIKINIKEHYLWCNYDNLMRQYIKLSPIELKAKPYIIDIYIADKDTHQRICDYNTFINNFNNIFDNYNMSISSDDSYKSNDNYCSKCDVCFYGNDNKCDCDLNKIYKVYEKKCSKCSNCTLCERIEFFNNINDEDIDKIDILIIPNPDYEKYKRNIINDRPIIKDGVRIIDYDKFINKYILKKEYKFVYHMDYYCYCTDNDSRYCHCKRNYNKVKIIKKSEYDMIENEAINIINNLNNN